MTSVPVMVAIVAALLAAFAFRMVLIACGDIVEKAREISRLKSEVEILKGSESELLTANRTHQETIAANGEEIEHRDDRIGELMEELTQLRIRIKRFADNEGCQVSTGV